MTTAREAARAILAEVARQPALRVPLDAALGSVLAESVASPLDVPPWTNSSMDGFAARAADVRGASAARPVRLRVVETIAAGRFPARAIGPGECARVFTGAPVPAGADTVVRQEDTAAPDEPGRGDPGDGEAVLVLDDRDAGANLRRAGEDVRRGDLVLAAGTPLGAAHLGVLASLAVAHPLVYRRPRVGILASGDELVDLDQPDAILAGRRVASSNTHTLRALVALAGGEPVDLGIARDTPASLRAHLERGRDCDLLVLNAGLSVGAHDHVRPTIAAMGGELRFWRVRMRPGAPVGFGLLEGRPWIGLPGNPVSTMVTFELFVRPAIRRMAGHALPFRRAVPVRTAEPITLGPRLQHFLRVTLEAPARPGEPPTARLTGAQGSGILTSMARADALLVVPEGQHETPAGAVLPAIVLDDPRHQAEPPFD
ncbi:MAG TPA: gephyrin-like molybdotransferase Glp [Gemmatimonadales bacterium]|nr:gephyrin-like molybdotransferase Glp [Gemmatimonadales bacterium]